MQKTSRHTSLPGSHSTTRWLLQLSLWDQSHNKMHGKHTAQEPGVEQTPEETRFCSASPHNYSTMAPHSAPLLTSPSLRVSVQDRHPRCWAVFRLAWKGVEFSLIGHICPKDDDDSALLVFMSPSYPCTAITPHRFESRLSTIAASNL